MKKMLFSVVILAVFAVPLQAVAGYTDGDYWANTGVRLQLAGPNTPVSEQTYGDRQPAVAIAPLGTRIWMDVPPGTTPGCAVDPSVCHNMSVSGYAEANLPSGTLKSSATSWVFYNYSATSTSPNARPNQAEAWADLRNTLSVTVPAGIGTTYHLGVLYDVAGTMAGTPKVGGSYAQAEVIFSGQLWAAGYGSGEGTEGRVWWYKTERAGEVTPYSTAGEFGIDFAGAADPYTVSVLMTLTLASAGSVYGIVPGSASSDFGSTAHASLAFDPGLLVTAQSPFPGASSGTPVPEPTPFLLLSSGLAGLGAVWRRFKK